METPANKINNLIWADINIHTVMGLTLASNSTLYETRRNRMGRGWLSAGINYINELIAAKELARDAEFVNKYIDLTNQGDMLDAQEYDIAQTLAARLAAIESDISYVELQRLALEDKISNQTTINALNLTEENQRLTLSNRDIAVQTAQDSLKLAFQDYRNANNDQAIAAKQTAQSDIQTDEYSKSAAIETLTGSVQTKILEYSSARALEIINYQYGKESEYIETKEKPAKTAILGFQQAAITKETNYEGVINSQINTSKQFWQSQLLTETNNLLSTFLNWQENKEEEIIDYKTEALEDWEKRIPSYYTTLYDKQLLIAEAIGKYRQQVFGSGGDVWSARQEALDNIASKTKEIDDYLNKKSSGIRWKVAADVEEYRETIFPKILEEELALQEEISELRNDMMASVTDYRKDRWTGYYADKYEALEGETASQMNDDYGTYLEAVIVPLADTESDLADALATARIARAAKMAAIEETQNIALAIT